MIASEHTAVWMDRFGSDLPRPTDILSWPDGSAEFDGTELLAASMQASLTNR